MGLAEDISKITGSDQTTTGMKQLGEGWLVFFNELQRGEGAMTREEAFQMTLLSATAMWQSVNKK